MWTDYDLMMPDIAAFAAVKADLEMAGAVIDEIGTLYRRDTGEASDGYHANVRLPDGVAMPVSAQAYVIAPPALPKRIFMP